MACSYNLVLFATLSPSSLSRLHRFVTSKFLSLWMKPFKLVLFLFTDTFSNDVEVLIIVEIQCSIRSIFSLEIFPLTFVDFAFRTWGHQNNFLKFERVQFKGRFFSSRDLGQKSDFIHDVDVSFDSRSVIIHSSYCNVQVNARGRMEFWVAGFCQNLYRHLCVWGALCDHW